MVMLSLYSSIYLVFPEVVNNGSKEDKKTDNKESKSSNKSTSNLRSQIL